MSEYNPDYAKARRAKLRAYTKENYTMIYGYILLEDFTVGQTTYPKNTKFSKNSNGTFSPIDTTTQLLIPRPLLARARWNSRKDGKPLRKHGNDTGIIIRQ